ncbi:heterokaryon incompatibility domain-containing protein [Trichoderma ceciliae]
MKKFSKILSRRLGRSGGGDDYGRWDAGLESAPDFHQLTSRRWRSGDDGLAMNGENHSRIFTKEDAGRLCAICEDIDFARLLDWQPGDARPWVSLAHCLEPKLQEEEEVGNGLDGTASEGEDMNEEARRRRRRRGRRGSPCPWCVFFHSMITTVPEGDEAGGAGGADGRDGRAMKGKFTPYLRIRLAFERLGGGEKHVLGKSVLFEVTTRNRSLPWGYIVKAAPAKQNGHAQVNGKGKGGDESRVIRGREISPLLRLGLAKNWVDFCNENHAAEACAVKDRSTVKGLKLIDCEGNRIVLAADLSTRTDHDEPQEDESQSIARSYNSYNSNSNSIRHHSVDYVTLSYVWGDSHDADWAPKFEQELDDGDHLPHELPKLIADAISATKGLGYRYLWVDRYCIPRKGDAERASERQRQLDLMGQIYSRSALTLVVAAGEGVHEGITGVSVPREEQLSIQTESALFTTSLLRPDLEVASSKWASRAWTYQEGLLSRRRLVFTPSQIYFQCQALHCHESLSLALKYAPELNFGRVFPSSAEDVLQPTKLKNHIKAYLAKSVGHTDDRLDALRGLLHEYSRREKLPVEHFLGLPLFHPDDFTRHKVVSQTDRLAVALGWMPNRTLPSSSISASTASSHDDLVHKPVTDPYSLVDAPCPFPSWTWLAWRLSQTTYNYNTASYSFNFNLVDDTSPLLDGVSAAPGMEISVGFSDGMVLSWEIDGDAIARKADMIEMLRLKTFCFDLTVKRAAGAGAKSALSVCEPAASALGKSAADAIEAWIRRSSSSSSASAGHVPVPVDDEYRLVGVLISGRHWKSDGAIHRATGAGSAAAAATALICRRKNWDPQGHFVRLGALSVAYDGLVPAADEGGASIMKGIDGRGGEKRRDLRVRLRELDIY